jgi:hypothetical protein
MVNSGIHAGINHAADMMDLYSICESFASGGFLFS